MKESGAGRRKQGKNETKIWISKGTSCNFSIQNLAALYLVEIGWYVAPFACVLSLAATYLTYEARHSLALLLLSLCFPTQLGWLFSRTKGKHNWAVVVSCKARKNCSSQNHSKRPHSFVIVTRCNLVWWWLSRVANFSCGQLVAFVVFLIWGVTNTVVNVSRN